jgi:hypothetical protein
MKSLYCMLSNPTAGVILGALNIFLQLIRVDLIIYTSLCKYVVPCVENLQIQFSLVPYCFVEL